MKRLLIMGPPGSGKTTLANKISDITGIEAIHLDYYFWNPGWKQTPLSKFKDIVKDLCSGEQWIVDGNYSKTLNLRLKRADSVIYLDINKYLCLWRCLKRCTLKWGQVRDDIGSGCPEHFDWEFFKYIWNFPKEEKPKVIESLNEASKNKEIIYLRSGKEVEAFLNNLKERRKICQE